MYDVSVVIPTFRRPHLVDKTISSVAPVTTQKETGCATCTSARKRARHAIKSFAAYNSRKTRISSPVRMMIHSSSQRPTVIEPGGCETVVAD